MAGAKRQFSDGPWIVDDATIERVVRAFIMWNLALKYSREVTEVDRIPILPDVTRVMFETDWDRVKREVEQQWRDQYRSWVQKIMQPHYRGVDVRGRLVGLAHNADDLNRNWREQVQARTRLSMKSIEDSVASGDRSISVLSAVSTTSEYVVLGLSIVVTAGASSALVSGTMTARGVLAVAAASSGASNALKFAKARTAPRPVPLVVDALGLGVGLLLDIPQWDGKAKLVVKLVAKPLAAAAEAGAQGYFQGKDLPQAARDALLAGLLVAASNFAGKKIEDAVERKLLKALDHSLDDLAVPLYPFGNGPTVGFSLLAKEDVKALSKISGDAGKQVIKAAGNAVLGSKGTPGAKPQSGAIALSPAVVSVSSSSLYERLLFGAFFSASA